MNIKVLFALVFYSLLTYWGGPALLTMTRGASTENSIVGATIGFAISILLWSIFAKELAY